MKPSYFNVFINEFPNEDEVLVYNARTQAMGVFDTGFAVLLEKFKGKSIELNQSKYQELINEGFCVEDIVEEEQILSDWFKENSNDNKEMNVTLLTTYNCNFGCPYCFEKNIKNKSVEMDKDTKANICDWIIKKIRERKIKKLNIFFYGGEPLLRKEVIHDIASRFFTESKKLGFEFKFGIVTNGYLINREDTMKFREYGLDFYRITLDGSEKWHDSSRFLRNGNPTFNRIMENIKNETEDVKILLSGNFTKETMPGFSDLIDFLNNNNLNKKIHSIDFSPIMNTEAIGCNSFHDACFKNMDEVYEISRLLEEEISNKGFKKSRVDIAMQRCPFKIKDTSVTIAPDGDIYKCPATVGKKEFRVGNAAFLNLNQLNSYILGREIWRDCFPCSYLPICSAGCYFKAHVEKGNMFAIDCPKREFELTLPNQIKAKYNELL
ncbi:MAG: hypothetical protein ACD_79C01527G0014 [uncultured bacterium]|nr:MAG: hypothetical protein ACD_79C01527G0014 [uncultured bacterium]